MSEILDFIINIFHFLSFSNKDFSKEVKIAKVLTCEESIELIIGKVKHQLESDPALADIKFNKILIYRLKKNTVKIILLNEGNKSVYYFKTNQIIDGEWIYGIINK